MNIMFIIFWLFNLTGSDFVPMRPKLLLPFFCFLSSGTRGYKFGRKRYILKCINLILIN